MSVEDDPRIIRQVLGVSEPTFFAEWISAITVFGLVLYQTLVKNSWIDQYYQERVRQPSPAGEKLQYASHYINTSEFFGNLTVFTAWFIIGLVVYAICMSLYHAFSGSIAAYESIHFSPELARKPLIIEILTRFGIRLAGIAIMAGLLLSFVKLGPLVIDHIGALSRSRELISIGVTALLLALTSVIAIHLLAISLRFTSLRIRFFY